MSAALPIKIRPIRTESDHAAALKEMERFWDDDSAGARAVVEVLSVLIDAYEREHHAIDAPDPIAAIEFRMEQLGMSRSALGDVIGSRSRATEVLSRQRPLTLQMIRRLNAKLGIPADVLIREAPVKARAAAQRKPAIRARKARTVRAAR